jgi:hypothetical protein
MTELEAALREAFKRIAELEARQRILQDIIGQAAQLARLITPGGS